MSATANDFRHWRIATKLENIILGQIYKSVYYRIKSSQIIRTLL